MKNGNIKKSFLSTFILSCLSLSLHAEDRIVAVVQYDELLNNYQIGNGGGNGGIGGSSPTIYQFSKVAAGDEHSLFIDTNGHLWGVGESSDGELGHSNDLKSLTLIDDSRNYDDVVASEGSSYILSHGELFVMGDNWAGQLGTGNTTDIEEITTTGITNVKEISSFKDGVMVLLNDGTLLVSGRNDFGNLGLDTGVVTRQYNFVTPSTNLYNDTVEESNTISFDTIDQNNNIYTFNLPTNVDRLRFDTITNGDDDMDVIMYVNTGNTVDSSSNYICESDEDHEWENANEYCIINNAIAGTYSILLDSSDGSFTDYYSNITYNVTTSSLLSSTAMTGVTDISLGAHSGYLIKDGFVWAAGFNPNYELGNGTNIYEENGFVNTGFDATGVTDIAAGYEFAYLIKNGELYVAGKNNDGELGIGDDDIEPTSWFATGITGVTAIDAGERHGALIKDGTLWVAGDNNDGELGVGNENEVSWWFDTGITGVTDFDIGWDHSFFVKDNDLYVTGDASYYRTGQGSSSTSSDIHAWALLSVKDSDGDGYLDQVDNDIDGDGFTNADEELNGTDKVDDQSTPIDTDGDFVSDAFEIQEGSDENDPNNIPKMCGDGNGNNDGSGPGNKRGGCDGTLWEGVIWN